MEPKQRRLYSDNSTGWTTEKSWFDSRRGKRIFFPLNYLYRSCGPPTFLYKCYCSLFPRDNMAGSWSLTTHIQLVPRLGTELSFASSSSSAFTVCMESNFPYLYVPVPKILKKERIESWRSRSKPYLTICCRLFTKYTHASVFNCNTLQCMWLSRLFFCSCTL
jgi:hypothetical protein